MNLQELQQLFALCRSYGVSSYQQDGVCFSFVTATTVQELIIPPVKEPDAVEKSRREAEGAMFRAMSDAELLTAHLSEDVK